MPLKCVLCADVMLEHHYRHMTTKKHQDYSQALNSIWKQFVGAIGEQDIQCLLIAGNLFASAKPRNESIELVAKSINQLAEKGVHTFILPGPNDTPLFHATDRPAHFILGTLPRTTILYSPEKVISRKVSEPLYAGEIGGNEVEIYAPPSPLINPDDLKMEFKKKPGKISIFCLYAEYTTVEDLHAFKDRVARVNKVFLKTLQDCKIDILILGGPQPEAVNLQKLKLKYKVIIAPQLTPVDFNFAEIPTGYRVQNLEEAAIKNAVLPVSDRKIVRKEVDVSNFPLDSINKHIINHIRESSDPHNFFQLHLTGTLSRADYHTISLHEFREKGSRLNFYFELVDEIAFQAATEDIVGFDPLHEVEKLVEKEKMNLKSGENSTGEENNEGEEKTTVILDAAMEKIRQDWKKLTTNESDEEGETE